MNYSREHPDEAPIHDAFAGQRRVRTVTVKRDGKFWMVSTATEVGSFYTAQDAANYCWSLGIGSKAVWDVRP